MKHHRIGFHLFLFVFTAVLRMNGETLVSDEVKARRVLTKTLTPLAGGPSNLVVGVDVVAAGRIDVSGMAFFREGIGYIAPQGDIPMGPFTNTVLNPEIESVAPAWWRTRQVVDEASVPDDFAAVTQGQLKWMSLQAAARLEETLRFRGGAGAVISNLVEGFSLTNNGVLVTIGQLKNTAEPFWQRLIGLGVETVVPWTTTQMVIRMVMEYRMSGKFSMD